MAKAIDVDLGLTDKVALVTGSYRGTGVGHRPGARRPRAHVVLVHGLEPGQADEVATEIADGRRTGALVVGR